MLEVEKNLYWFPLGNSYEVVPPRVVYSAHLFLFEHALSPNLASKASILVRKSSRLGGMMKMKKIVVKKKYSLWF